MGGEKGARHPEGWALDYAASNNFEKRGVQAAAFNRYLLRCQIVRTIAVAPVIRWRDGSPSEEAHLGRSESAQGSLLSFLVDPGRTAACDGPSAR